MGHPDWGGAWIPLDVTAALAVAVTKATPVGRPPAAWPRGSRPSRSFERVVVVPGEKLADFQRSQDSAVRELRDAAPPGRRGPHPIHGAPARQRGRLAPLRGSGEILHFPKGAGATSARQARAYRKAAAYPSEGFDTSDVSAVRAALEAGPA